MAEDFDEAATTFDNVTFGGVECREQKKICDSYKVKGYPTIKLFLAGSKKSIEFSGTRSLDGFCDFVENYTTARARRPPRYTTDLHPLNFDDYVNNTQCLFVTFYAPWCVHCKHFLPQFRLAAKAFLPDRANVTFGLVNCGQYTELCKPQAEGYPTIRLWMGGKTHDYPGARKVAGLAEFLNEKCGTERGPEGLLSDKAGLIPEADAVIAEFLKASDKSSYISKLVAIPGAEFYVKACQRYIEKGPEQITKDRATISGILAAQKGSWAVLDSMKRKFNIFGEFFPKPSILVPTPEPTPEPTSPAIVLGDEPEGAKGEL
jgi:protein disulfide-isomerase A6